jgi:membrane protease YdiL (CAAX protease family)
MVMKSISTVASRLSPRIWPKQGFSLARIASFLTLLIAAFGIALVLGVASVAIFDHRSLWQSDLSHMTVGLLAALTLAYVPVLLVFIFALPAVAGRSLRELGFAPLRLRDFAYAAIGVPVAFAAFRIVEKFQYAIWHIPFTETATDLYRTTTDPLFLAVMMFFTAIVVPLTEEFFFRGFLFNALYRYMPAWIAIVLSSTFFGICHGLNALLPTACVGAVLAIVYYRSGSLTASILLHAVVNATSLALGLFPIGKG